MRGGARSEGTFETRESVDKSRSVTSRLYSPYHLPLPIPSPPRHLRLCRNRSIRHFAVSAGSRLDMSKKKARRIG